MPHPVHTGPAPPALVAGHPGGLPARRGHVLFGPCCVGRCSAAGGSLTSASAFETAGGLRRCWLMLIVVGWCWVVWFVPNLCRGSGRRFSGRTERLGPGVRSPMGGWLRLSASWLLLARGGPTCDH